MELRSIDAAGLFDTRRKPTEFLQSPAQLPLPANLPRESGRNRPHQPLTAPVYVPVSRTEPLAAGCLLQCPSCRTYLEPLPECIQCSSYCRTYRSQTKSPTESTAVERTR